MRLNNYGLVRKALYYAPEMEISMTKRLEMGFAYHPCQRNNFKKGIFTKELYQPQYANDGLFLYMNHCLKTDNWFLKLFSDTESYTKLQELRPELQKFEDFIFLMDEIYILLEGFNFLHVENHVKGSVSNFTSFNLVTNEQKIQDFKILIEQYREMHQQLEDFPEWQAKLQEAVFQYVDWFHMFHLNEQLLDDIVPEFNKHEYFK